MNLVQKSSDWKIVNSVNFRTEMLAYISVITFIAYHFSMIFIFHYLKIQVLYLSSIISTVVFLICLALIKRDTDLKLTWLLITATVIVEQIFVEYFLGIHLEFHYHILWVGLMPFFIFNEDFLFSFMLSLSCIITFSIICLFGDVFLFPQYLIPPHPTLIIRIINIVISAIALLFILLLFKLIIFNKEKDMETKIAEQAEKLQAQNKKIISIQNSTIIGLSNLVENRDSDTGEHVKRTSVYVALLAKKAMASGVYTDIITEHYIDLLSRAAPLHDVGKIVVSDAVLKKPGRLTPDEFEQIKRHTTEGGKIILSILSQNDDTEYVKMACDIALYHHEKWDGTGYPIGLKQEAIPLSARIMAVADVFDALVSPRCYKKPMSLEEAFLIIKDGAGTHFDPILASLFLELRQPIEQTMSTLQEKDA